MKHKKLLFFVFLPICVIVLVFILVVGYFGFVPGVSSIFGSDKPKDLGVNYSSADYTALTQKSGVSVQELSTTNALPEKSLVYSGTKYVDASFADKEISALVSEFKWKYLPVTQVQVKYTDNTVEVSGLLIKDRITNYGKATGISQSELDEINKYIGYIPSQVPFYLKGNVSMTNNILSLNPQQFEIGRFPIDKSMLVNNISSIETFFMNRLKSVPNLDIQSGKVENGKLIIKGTIPAKLSFEK